MATNGLSTIYGGIEGEGLLKISVAATASSATVLPDVYNEECFIEVFCKQGSGYGSFYVYNPGSTTAPVRILANSSTVGTAGANTPVVQAALSTGTINDPHIVYFVKNATTGKCSIIQTASATNAAATVWMRRIG